MAQVINFPMVFRTGKIRRTADVLSERHGKGAEAYWRQVVNGFVGQMARAGFSDELIRSEIGAFSAAVQAELQERYRHPNGGDAA